MYSPRLGFKRSSYGPEYRRPDGASGHSGNSHGGESGRGYRRGSRYVDRKNKQKGEKKQKQQEQYEKAENNIIQNCINRPQNKDHPRFGINRIEQTEVKPKRRGMFFGKTKKYKKAVVKLTADSKDIEIFMGM